MKKLVQRLLVFFIGLPLVILLVVFLPQKNHLAVNLAVILLCSLGALELAEMLKLKGLSLSSPQALILGSLLPLAATAEVSFGLGNGLAAVPPILGASWVLISPVFSPKGDFDASAGRIAAGFSAMVYPGLFMAWIVLMARWPRADMMILVFFLIIFINDSMAWAAGMLFGKNNRGIIPASPGKSLAGFIGGFAASILSGVLAVFFLPDLFGSPRLPPVLAGMLLGFLLALAGSLGDLGESVIKRSAGVKDSGSLIPGRGGVLDTIDSIALAAPVYYFICRLLFFPL